MNIIGPIFGFILKHVPEQYSWKVAAKKISFTVGKLAVSGLMMGVAGKYVGSNLTPEQLTQVEGAVGVVVAGGLEAVHDYLKVKLAGTPIGNYL